mgnify:CR=1 FL=1
MPTIIKKYRLNSYGKTAIDNIENKKEYIKHQQDTIAGHKYLLAKEELALNNKPDSPFYGLKHMTKFQTLKYIADSFDISDDIVDNIYKKLKQQQLWKHIGRFDTSMGVAGEWFKIPHSIHYIMTEPRLTGILTDKTRLLARERKDILQYYKSYNFKIDKEISIQCIKKNHNQKTLTTYSFKKYNILTLYSGNYSQKEMLKTDLQALCTDRGILFKKSWTKDKLVKELVK